MRLWRTLRQRWTARRFELAKAQLEHPEPETIADRQAMRSRALNPKATTTTEWRGD